MLRTATMARAITTGCASQQAASDKSLPILRHPTHSVIPPVVITGWVRQPRAGINRRSSRTMGNAEVINPRQAAVLCALLSTTRPRIAGRLSWVLERTRLTLRMWVARWERIGRRHWEWHVPRKRLRLRLRLVTLSGKVIPRALLRSHVSTRRWL